MSLIDTAKDIYELAKKGATLELQERLVRIREEALSLQEENLSLRQKVADLEGKLKTQDSLHFDGSLYWLIDDEGQQQGPYCQCCYDVDRRMVRLQDASYIDVDRSKTKLWTCRGCEKSYSPE